MHYSQLMGFYCLFFLTYQINHGRKRNKQILFFLLCTTIKCFGTADASIDGKTTTVLLYLFHKKCAAWRTCAAPKSFEVTNRQSWNIHTLLRNLCFSFFTEHSLYSRSLAGCKLVGSAAWLDSIRKTGLCRSAAQNLTGPSEKLGVVWTTCQWSKLLSDCRGVRR